MVRAGPSGPSILSFEKASGAGGLGIDDGLYGPQAHTNVSGPERAALSRSMWRGDSLHTASHSVLG